VSDIVNNQQQPRGYDDLDPINAAGMPELADSAFALDLLLTVAERWVRLLWLLKLCVNAGRFK